MIYQYNEKLKIKSKLFRGFSDPTRLSILECLRNGEKGVNKIVQEVKQSQSNVSNHLSCLLECGLVKNRREGKNIFYSIRNVKVMELLDISDIVISEVYQEIFACTRYEK
ncbi:MAG: ArsR/SmtB family transcription factor [Promethearchaeota archaeon]